MPLWIWGSPVGPDAARRMVATLVGAGTPESCSAAAAITRSVDADMGLVGLEEVERDALLYVLEDDGDDQVVELREALGRDHRRRWGE